jgi:hypothetical protein
VDADRLLPQQLVFGKQAGEGNRGRTVYDEADGATLAVGDQQQHRPGEHGGGELSRRDQEAAATGLGPVRNRIPGREGGACVPADQQRDDRDGEPRAHETSGSHSTR